jgi:hypothetical protein
MSSALLDEGSIWIDDQFLDDPESLYSALVRSITWDQRIRARMAMSFGVPYNYSGIEWPQAPFPESLAPVLDLLADAVGFRPNNCLAHYYPDGGSTMGYHSDSTEHLEPGTGIAIVSLGAERVLSFRNERDRRVAESYPLRGGSLLYMRPEMQTMWKHGILTSPDVNAGRISLTFRRMREDVS